MPLAPSTTQPPSDPDSLRRAAEPVYAFLAAAFCVVLVLTNIIGVKLFHLPDGLGLMGGMTLTSGIITYPLTFLLTDVVSEIWGRRRANHMVIMGFVMSLLMLAIVRTAQLLPSSSLWANPELGLGSGELQAAFEATFYYPGLLLFASMLAYLVAQLFDVRLYHFWWRVTGGRHMWIRNNGSTAISQLVDTLIVNGIFLRFGLKMEWGTIGTIIVGVYLCKLILALLDTPLIYLARGILRRSLRIDPAADPMRAPLA